MDDDAQLSTSVVHAPGTVHVRGIAILTVTAAGAMYVLHEAAPVLVPIAISLLLAYAFEPAVAALVRWRIPRIVAAAIVFLIAAMLIGSIVRGIRDQVIAFVDDLPATVATLRHVFDRAGDTNGIVARLREAANEVAKLSDVGSTPTPNGVPRVAIVRPHFDIAGYLQSASVDIALTTGGLLVVAILTFLLVATGDLYKRKLVKLAGPRLSEKKITVEIIESIDRQIARYLVARLLISAIVAVATGVPLWLLGVARPAVWGLVAGALNVLPFIGPTVAVALIALATFLQFQAPGITAAAAGAATIVAVVEGNFITPVLCGRAGELNTVAIFVAVLVWGWAWGVWGLVLAVPIVVAVKAVADRIEPLNPIGELLGR